MGARKLTDSENYFKEEITHLVCRQTGLRAAYKNFETDGVLSNNPLSFIDPDGGLAGPSNGGGGYAEGGGNDNPLGLDGEGWSEYNRKQRARWGFGGSGGGTSAAYTNYSSYIADATHMANQSTSNGKYYTYSSAKSQQLWEGQIRDGVTDRVKVVNHATGEVGSWKYGYLGENSRMESGGFKNNSVFGYEFVSEQEQGGGRNLTFSQAKTLYQFGGGSPVHVDLSAIDLSRVTIADFNNRGLATVKLDSRHFSNTNDALVHGTITLQLLPGSNQAKIALNSGRDYPALKGQPAGMFNFEMQSWSEPINWIRNPATFLGGLINGTSIIPIPTGFTPIPTGGTPFPIYYNGTVTISR